MRLIRLRRSGEEVLPASIFRLEADKGFLLLDVLHAARCGQGKNAIAFYLSIAGGGGAELLLLLVVVPFCRRRGSSLRAPASSVPEPPTRAVGDNHNNNLVVDFDQSSFSAEHSEFS